MNEPDVGEVLTAAIGTIEDDIAPNVTADDDGYTASLCRTVAQLLRAARSRVEHEEPSLAADNEELRALLTAWSPVLPEQVREVVGNALQAEGGTGARTAVARLAAESDRLRAALVALIAAVPDPENPVRVDCREYLRHHLERQRPWMVDAFTGPRR